MNRITAIALLTLSSLVAAGSAVAADRAVQANIPFDFTVGNQMLPAGTYTIASLSNEILEVKSIDRQKWVRTVALPSHADAIGRGDLVFDHYGNQYFLRDVVCPSTSMHAHLPTWKMEKWARTREASIPYAGQTLVALK